MTVFLTSIQSIIPIIVIIALGYILQLKGWFSESFGPNLSRLIMNVALPVSIFVSVLKYLTVDKLISLSGGLLYTFGAFALTYIFGFLAVKLCGVRAGRRGTMINTFVNANTIFIGLPLNIALFGEEALPYFLIYYITNTISTWTLGVYIMTSDSVGGKKKEGTKFCTDPQKLDQESNDWEVGIFMAKYSFEFKKKVVVAYTNGEGGYRYLAKIYGIPTKSIVERWVHNYKRFGDNGLRRSRKKQIYSFEKKRSVVELYLTSEISYQALALQEGLSNACMIANWVNRFRASGPDGLKPHKKGKKKPLKKPIENVSIPSTKTPIDASKKRIKELEDELLKLRIENAFLKELRRLRLEDEAKMRERRSSSTVSEESSN